MSLLTRALIVAAIVAAVVAGWWRLTAFYDNRGYQRAKLEDKVAADDQAQRNRDLQRAAEKRYTVQAETRERVITETIVEVRHATASLAACPVPEPARRLLNRASECARQDRPAAGCAGDGVQPPE